MPKIVFTFEMEMDEEIEDYTKEHINELVKSLEDIIKNAKLDQTSIKRYLSYFQNFADLERLHELEEILYSYINLFEDGRAIEHIKKAFTLGKPVSSIELNRGHLKKKLELVEKLEEFFFVNYYEEYNTILVSRSDDSLEILDYFMKKYKGCYDKFGFVAGLFFGYQSKQIKWYCTQDRMKKYDLIK